MRSVWTTVLAGLCVGAVACAPAFVPDDGAVNNPDMSTSNPDATSPDSSVRPDGATGSETSVRSDGGADVARTDAARTDSGTPADVMMLPPVTGTCAMPLNLNTMGTALTMGTGRQFSGSNGTTAEAPLTTVPAPSCTGATNHAGHAIVMHYTMQAAGFLVASTDTTATDANFDTVVFMLDGCSTTATELACNDDADANNGVVQSTAVSNRLLAAGTVVTIVVAGYTPPVGGGVNTGNFGLVVQEYTPNANGAACMASNPFCNTGYTCVGVSATASGTCNANGTNNARCNVTGMACNTGLRCSADMPTAAAPGICQMPIAVGSPCDYAGTFVCTMGAHCIPTDLTDPNATMGTCRTDGTSGGECIGSAGTCNMGLTCDTTTGVCM